MKSNCSARIPSFLLLMGRGASEFAVRAPTRTRRGDEPNLLAVSIPVDNVAALCAEYRAAGVPFHQELHEQPWGNQDFVVRDVDGKLVHFSVA